jgi:hypothetical protein
MPSPEATDAAVDLRSMNRCKPISKESGEIKYPKKHQKECKQCKCHGVQPIRTDQNS